MDIEVVRHSKFHKKWVIRRPVSANSDKWNRASGNVWEYWNGSWSLASFFDTHATPYTSRAKALADYALSIMSKG